MTTQQELDLTVTGTDLERMRQVLLHASPWPVTARHFGAYLSWTERKARAVAEASGGEIVGTPSGYRLNSTMDDEEFADNQRYWRGMHIKGLMRQKAERDYRFRDGQSLMDFLQECINA